MRFILLTVVLHFSLFLPAQESIIVKARQQNTAYIGCTNPINVFVEGYSCASLSVTTDNGRIEKTGCYYYYTPSRLGGAALTIYKNHKGKRVKLKEYKWYVIPLPKPKAWVGGYMTGSEIPKGALCVQQGVGASVANDLGFELSYRVDSFSVVIMHDSTIQFSSGRTGNTFDEKTLEAFRAVQPGSIVLIVNIWVEGADRKAIKVDPLEYLII